MQNIATTALSGDSNEDSPSRFIVVGADCGGKCISVPWSKVHKPNLVDFDVVVLIGRGFTAGVTPLLVSDLDEVNQKISRMLMSGGELIVVTGPFRAVQLPKSSAERARKISVSLDRVIPFNWKLHEETGSSLQAGSKSRFDFYLQKLKTWRFWIEPPEGTGTQAFLANREGRTLAGQFRKGPLQITILPDIADYDVDGLARMVLRSFGLITDDVPAPPWAEQASVPGISDVMTEIAQLDAEIRKLGTERERLDIERTELEKYRKLLYSQGDDLEGIVAEVLKKLGAEMLDERYSDEDLLFRIGDQSCVVEITGTEGALKLTKIRQLFTHAFDVEEKSGVRPKGIMIANPLRLVPPDMRTKSATPEVPPNVAARAREMSLSVVLGRWLFKRYCEFLEDKADGEAILAEILNTNGVISEP